MRLIVGATARSNIVNVLNEMGSVNFQNRINDIALVMLFKIQKGYAPGYLTHILDSFNGQRNYNLRNSNIRVFLKPTRNLSSPGPFHYEMTYPKK